MKLYVFNPDSDMALAHNNENYLAPASIRIMAQDLALLPIWYAVSGSYVLASSAYNADYLKEMQRLFSLPVGLLTEPELPECSDVDVLPWGWTLALRKRLLSAGFPERKLPAKDSILTYRRLSSRETAMMVLNTFEYEGREKYCGISRSLPTLSDCKEFVTSRDACVLKAPWSGSGKGLNWCKGNFTKSIEGWCKHVIQEQGAVYGEPLYNKVVDFAMEFYADGHDDVCFLGYSLFSTNSSGAYSGNVLMSAEDIENRIARYVPLNILTAVRERLCSLLPLFYGTGYAGFLGVDLMVCQLSDGEYVIHPCVEINMRMNMGVLSLLFQKNFMAPNSTGHFSIEYYPSNEELRKKHEQELEACPLVVEDKRIVSGYLPLVPVTSRSCYRAYVHVLSSNSSLNIQ